MLSTGNFAQQAITEHGKKIGDAKVFETRKGETTVIKIETSSTGKNMSSVEVMN